MAADPPTSTSHWRWALLASVPALVLAAWQAAWPWPFFSDDAFVSLRYADRLLAGDGLTWTDGERVEGYSNLLWVLGCAGLGALGIDLVFAARALGAACTAVALWWLASAHRPADLPTSLVAAIAPLLVASSGTVMAWTLGGLEGPMMLATLAWGFGSLARELSREPRTDLWQAHTLRRCSVPFALACLTRPDSPLWVAAAGIVLGLAAWRGGGRAVVARTSWFALLPLLTTGAQLTFRLAYYGEWVPNTAYVKAQFDPGSGTQGFEYVASALWMLPGLTWPAVVGFAVLTTRRSTRTLGLVLAVPVLLWCGYVASIGGDHFPGRRLMHGALAPMALLAGLGCLHLRTHLLAAFATTASMLAAAAFGVHLSRTDGKFTEVRHETWEWHGKVVGEGFARAFGDTQPRLAVDSAGVVPFYSRLPALDMLGLCDRTIAKTPFRDWLLEVKARGEVILPPGHLRGNGAYVMEQSPDLILMGPPPGLPLPVFVSAHEFEYDPRFLQRYRCVLVDFGRTEVLPGTVVPIVSPLWVLLHGRAGVRAEADRIEVPAWLFGGYTQSRPLTMRRLPPPPDTAEGAAIAAGLHVITDWFYGRRAVAVPAANGQLELELRTPVATFAQLVPAGTWSLRVEPANAPVTVTAADRAVGPTPASFVVDHTSEVVLTMTAAAPSDLPVRVQRIVLARQE